MVNAPEKEPHKSMEHLITRIQQGLQKLPRATVIPLPVSVHHFLTA